jgi:hypothetical protein
MIPCITAEQARTEKPWCNMTHVYISNGEVLYKPERSIGVLLFSEDGNPIMAVGECSDDEIMNLFITTFGDSTGFIHYPNPMEDANDMNDPDCSWDLMQQTKHRPPATVNSGESFERLKELYR